MIEKRKQSTDISIIWVTVLSINRPGMSEVSAEPSAAYLPILCTIWQHQSPLYIKPDQWDSTTLPSYSNHGLNFPLQTSCITCRLHDPICSKNKCLVSSLPPLNNILIVTIYSKECLFLGSPRWQMMKPIHILVSNMNKWKSCRNLRQSMFNQQLKLENDLLYKQGFYHLKKSVTPRCPPSLRAVP